MTLFEDIMRAASLRQSPYEMSPLQRSKEELLGTIRSDDCTFHYFVGLPLALKLIPRHSLLLAVMLV